MDGKTNQLRDDSYISGLKDFCRDLIQPESVLAELGCFGGESTAIFACSAAKVYAVDPWDEEYRISISGGCKNSDVIDYLKDNPVPPMSEIEEIFDARTADFDNVVKIKKTAEAAVQEFDDGSLDLVYIDSIHTYDAVKKQISDWYSKIKPGGVLAGHDFHSTDWPGVVNAVLEMVGPPTHIYTDTSWAIRTPH